MTGVLVVNAEGQYVETITPAEARNALKAQRVVVFRQIPFTVQLPAGLSRCPRVFRKATAMLINFTEIFEKERDIWVRFLGRGQLSMEFKQGNQNVPCPPIPYTGDPVCLTQFVSFEMLKNSLDFKRMATAQPPIIEIMTHQEATAFYEKKAKKLKLNGGASEAYARSEKLRKDMLGKEEEQAKFSVTRPIEGIRKVEQVVGDDVTVKVAGSDATVTNTTAPFLGRTELAQPRVVGLCAGGMNARETINELEDMEERKQLTVDDLKFVMKNSPWMTVQKWAAKRLPDEEGEEGEADGEEDTGVADADESGKPSATETQLHDA